MLLPDLKYDFSHALIVDVRLGPRRETTLSVKPLAFSGRTGRFGCPITVRFGGIANFNAVGEFFTMLPQDGFELARLEYDKTRPSKTGQLFFNVVLERVDAQLTIECSSLTVIEAANENGDECD